MVAVHHTTLVLQAASHFGQKAVEDDVTAMLRCVAMCMVNVDTVASSDGSGDLERLASFIEGQRSGWWQARTPLTVSVLTSRQAWTCIRKLFCSFLGPPKQPSRTGS